ncbi:MAG TPA: hypothetical protein VI076_16140 [Actinopolymorphaceae bacterium]
MTEPAPGDTPPGTSSGAPRRVVVTGPGRAASRLDRHHVAREIDAQTRLGQVYMGTLIKTQLQLGLLVLAVIGALLLGLPVIFAVAPELGGIEVLGLPLPWLLLGVVVHPTLVAAGWFYVRQAERNERDFAELVERSSG